MKKKLRKCYEEDIQSRIVKWFYVLKDLIETGAGFNANIVDKIEMSVSDKLN